MNEKLTRCFAEALNLDPARITDDLAYQSVTEWDSVAHMALVAALESDFGIMLDTDDIIGMSSVAVARTILVKYGVSFAA